VLFDVLNDKYVAGLTGLVSAHLLRSHSLHCVCTWSAVVVLSVGAIFEKNISKGSVATHLRHGEICNDHFIANFLLSV